MRIAALDISRNNIGLAITDEDQLFISYETTISPKNNKLFREKLHKIFKEYIPELTYIGLPLDFDMKLNDSSRFIKIFTHNIRDIIGKFEFIDENNSTVYIKSLMKEKIIKSFHSIDSAVARGILMEKIK